MNELSPMLAAAGLPSLETLIWGLLFWLVKNVGLHEMFARVATNILYVVGVLFLIICLLSLIGLGPRI